MRKFLIAIAVLTASPVFAQNNDAIRYSNTITPASLRTKLSVIASAEMEGRETATPGQKKAAAYIENYFRSLGLLPGTSTGYQMHYPVYVDTLMDASLIVNGKKFTLGHDYSFDITGMPTGNWIINTVIYAGTGVVSETRDDYKGLNVKNQWVLIDEGTSTETTSLRRLTVLRRKVEQARLKGAKGVILITKDFPKKSFPLKGSMYLKKTVNSVPTLSISYGIASAIFNQQVDSTADLSNIHPSVLNTKAHLSVYKRAIMLESSNVIGIMPGTDKKDEYVMLTGHYDHIGKRGNDIYYGADDDGSGTTSVIQMAEAFAQAKAEGHGPRRTIVFMTVSGEEEGLLGSQFYSENPVFPLNKTSVNLNTDMVGRIDPGRKEGDSTNYIYVIGEDKLSSDLMKITDSVNNQYIKLELDRRFNANDPNRFYYRSDHYNFAKKGVPILFYFNGTHADYHRTTDTVDKINFDLMAKRVKLVFNTAWVMANRNEMLKRDIPLR
ncbi:MAG: M28 family peptidase [Segetibacter sp.]|nr:M28 family peptidase [Segetibacter sp.]